MDQQLCTSETVRISRYTGIALRRWYNRAVFNTTSQQCIQWKKVCGALSLDGDAERGCGKVDVKHLVNQVHQHKHGFVVSHLHALPLVSEFNRSHWLELIFKISCICLKYKSTYLGMKHHLVTTSLWGYPYLEKLSFCKTPKKHSYSFNFQLK